MLYVPLSLCCLFSTLFYFFFFLLVCLLFFFFFFSSRRRHTRFDCDWSSDVCSSDLSLGDREGGLALARALAMTTYRTRAELERRFPVDAGAGKGSPVFEVERYLLTRGETYAKSARAEAFLCLSESVDLHRIDPRAIRVPVTLAAVAEDQLVTVDDVRELGGGSAGPRGSWSCIPSSVTTRSSRNASSSHRPSAWRSKERRHDAHARTRNRRRPCRHRERRAPRRRRAADPPVHELHVRGLRPAASLRLHALRKSDARPARQCARRARGW